MSKDPVPADIMRILIGLAHLPADRAGNRARFNAVFSACAGMGQAHPELALHWLEALKPGLSWRRRLSINRLSRDITARTLAERQLSLF